MSLQADLRRSPRRNRAPPTTTNMSGLRVLLARGWLGTASVSHEKVAAVEVTVPRVVDENDFAHPFQVEVLRADLVLHRCRSGSED